MTIFRKVALERLSSPEQLDQLLRVTNPRGWLALASLGGVLLAALIWGITGSIPTEAQGEGILLRQGGVSDVVSTGQGQVEEVATAVGESVERGQVVVRIRQDELLRAAAETRAQLAAAGVEYEALQRYAGEQKRLQARNRVQERANLERTIGSLEREIEILRERLTAERLLLDDGLVTKQTVLGTEQSLNTTLDQIASQRLALDGLALTRLEVEQQLDEQLEARSRQVEDLKRSLADQEAKLEENANVVSPYRGRVLELMVNDGDVVSAGVPIMTLEVDSEELVAVLFVPASAGKQAQVGMEVRLTPSTVKREEFGYILGEVTWVAKFPSTSRGMLRLLANQELVSKLMKEGPPIQVDVRLRPDAETPTGFAWSSSRGPDIPISSGTLAAGSVIVREDRPIDLVIPKVREKLGI